MRGGVRVEGCSSLKIDIHLNHKSELSQCLWGGEIIIGLVLDYTLCRAEARAACKCALLCCTPTSSPSTHTRTDVHGKILSLRCIEGSMRCRPCALLSGHVLGQINTCVQWVTPCQLITPSMKSLPAALDLEDEQWAPWAGMHAWTSEVLASGHVRQQQSVRTLLWCLAMEDGELVCAPAFPITQCIRSLICWGKNQYCPPSAWWRFFCEH